MDCWGLLNLIVCTLAMTMSRHVLLSLKKFKLFASHATAINAMPRVSPLQGPVMGFDSGIESDDTFKKECPHCANTQPPRSSL